MAEAYGKKFLGEQFEIYSAGIEKHGLNPFMLKVLHDDGVDTSKLYSKTLDDLEEKNFDYVITLCGHANETCPMYLKKTRLIHKGFEDPAKADGSEEDILTEFKKVRDEIKRFIQNDLYKIIIRSLS